MQNVVKQAFTEKTASGTELTIDNTIEARMDLKLQGNTKQQKYSGKNLLNGKYQNTSTVNGITLKLNNDNSFDITGTATSNTTLTPIYSIDQSNLVVGNTYYFYMSEKYDDTNLNVSLMTNTPALSYWIANKAYTIAKNQKFNNITLYIPSGVTMNYHNVKFMIVQGSTATSYEPYVGGTASPNPDYPQDIKVVSGDNTIKISNSNNTLSQSFPISLGSLELCKIGDYQDYIYKKDDKWLKHKKIGKIKLSSSEMKNTYKMKNVYSYNFYDNNIKNDGVGICNYYPYSQQGNWYATEGTKNFYINTTGHNIRFTNGEIEDKSEDFKKFIDSNNVYVYYQVATPTEEQITDTALITQLDEISQALSKKGTTIISQSNDDLPFNLDVIALTK